MCGAQILTFFVPRAIQTKGGGLFPHHQDHSGGPAGGHILSSGPLKISIFDRFYKVFDMAESHSVYSEKPNAFCMIFGAKTRKWLQKYQ